MAKSEEPRKNEPISLKEFFEIAIKHAFYERMEFMLQPEIESYLVQLLCSFLREDNLFPLKDENGQVLNSILEMLQYGDIRLKASSFDQERRVHRHIGDLLLFSSGLFPDLLKRLGIGSGDSLVKDASHQGKECYLIASSFDYDPHAEEAKVFKKLSESFTDYQYGLGLIRKTVCNIGGSNWTGLSA